MSSTSNFDLDVVAISKEFEEKFSSNSYYREKGFDLTLPVTVGMLSVGDMVLIKKDLVFSVVSVCGLTSRRIGVSFSRSTKYFDRFLLKLTRDTSNFNPWGDGELVLPTLENYINMKAVLLNNSARLRVKSMLFTLKEDWGSYRTELEETKRIISLLDRVNFYLLGLKEGKSSDV